jgi:pimeloyl-ACP methyl ester carboxylesterase
MSLLAGVSSKTIKTSRLSTHALFAGSKEGAPVLFVHGNVSSSRFFEETLAAMPAGYYSIALDLRGFGDSETKAVDATRGVRDFSDDLHSLIEALALTQKVHLVGWSVGGGVVMQYAIDHADKVASLTLLAPMSPYGFGGTKDAAGTPCFADFAGSGGGTANPDFVKRLGDKDASEEADTSPRKIMNTYYFKPPFRVEASREKAFVSSLLATKVGPESYPGDLSASPNWPTLAPGKTGMNNAISGQYCNLSAFATINPKPKVLWIRGADDQIVSDTSLFDFGFLGSLGAIPGWPGNEVFPAQPMIAQTRAVLNAYQKNGGSYLEEVFADCGHSPHIEGAQVFRKAFFEFIK